MKCYADAVNHYDAITKPPRSKKWKPDTEAGRDNGKPLRRTSETHMSIHKRDNDGSIYYKLYDTIVATFYPPQADGTERRTFKYVATQTTEAFMSSYFLHFGNVVMDDGTEARIPYTPHGGWRDNDKLTADLVVNSCGQVVRSRSSHKDVYTMVSSADDKLKRKEFKKRLESLITLATFNMVSLQANCQLDCQYGEPFGTAYNEPRELSSLKRYIRLQGADLEDEVFIGMFMPAVQGAFDVYASKLAYIAGGWDWGNYYWEGNTRLTDEEGQARKAEHEKQKEQIRLNTLANITPEGFTKSLTNMLLTAAQIKAGTVKKPWGQFMPKLPYRWID